MNKQEIVKLIVAGTSGIVLGYSAGAVVTSFRIRKQLSAVLDEEIARMTEELNDIRNRSEKTGPYASPADAAEHLGMNDIELDTDEISVDGVDYSDHPEMPDIVFPDGVENPEQYRTVSDLPEGEQPVLTDIRQHFKDAEITEDGMVLTRPGRHRESFVQNVFEEEGHHDEEADPSEWTGPNDLNDPNKDTNRPYVITLEDFQTTHDEYQKAVVVYYEGDDTLTDEADTIIPDIGDANIGHEAKERFGHGSEAPDTVYIRNEKQEVDFEVVRIKRGFAEELYGIPEEDEPRGRLIQRMRGDDE